MSPFNEKPAFEGAGQYVKKVCEQVRWGKAHRVISEELLNHMEDQKAAFLQKGQQEEEAEKNAVLEMGDAVTVGQQLDRTHRPRPDWGTLLIVGVCIVVSIVLRYFLSLNAGGGSQPAVGYFYPYLAALPLGIAVMIGIYFMDYSIVGKYPKSLYGIVLACCLLGYGFSPQINYVHIHVFYYALILTCLYGGIVYSQRGKSYSGVVFCGAVGVISCLVFGLRVSVTWMFALNGAVLLTAAIKRDWFRVQKKYALALVWVPVAFIIMMPFLLYFRRFKYMFITEGAEYGQSYVLNMVREILSNAKLFGQGKLPSYMFQSNMGLEEGNIIESLLPSWKSDYSLTYMIYKLGWVAAVIVLILVVFLMVRLFKIVNKQSSQLGYMISLGVTITVIWQSVIFLLNNLGICNWSSCPLPFISPGNSSFVVNMGLMGLILSAYRNNSIFRDRKFSMKSAAGSFGEDPEQHCVNLWKWQLTIRKL
ncbi:FtsW/RodA/SpoVE family cell cycle protein [Aminipila luticellarii]|nr:FtsW/RodA/SpoVE family cell cycle protein [Aminipila luticellarii]